MCPNCDDVKNVKDQCMFNVQICDECGWRFRGVHAPQPHWRNLLNSWIAPLYTGPDLWDAGMCPHCSSLVDLNWIGLDVKHPRDFGWYPDKGYNGPYVCKRCRGALPWDYPKQDPDVIEKLGRRWYPKLWHFVDMFLLQKDFDSNTWEDILKSEEYLAWLKSDKCESGDNLLDGMGEEPYNRLREKAKEKRMKELSAYEESHVREEQNNVPEESVDPPRPKFQIPERFKFKVSNERLDKLIPIYIESCSLGKTVYEFSKEINESEPKTNIIVRKIIERFEKQGGYAPLLQSNCSFTPVSKGPANETAV